MKSLLTYTKFGKPRTRTAAPMSKQGKVRESRLQLKLNAIGISNRDNIAVIEG